jgi:hypothetical protein
MRKHALDILKILCDNDWWVKSFPIIEKDSHRELFMTRLNYYILNIEPDLVKNSPFYFIQLREEITYIISEINERFPDLI